MKVIPLTRGEVTFVDDGDYERLSQFKWCVSRQGGGKFQAVRRKPGSRGGLILMHREILKAPDHLQVDHRNGNPLDNQRENLRSATNQQNKQGARNRTEGLTSQFRGVSLRSDTKKFTARITVNGKNKCLGSFTAEEAAARAYDTEALKNFGEFADLNFPR